MKAIKCEMCGSNNLVKQEGMYVCQMCGTKYTTEEARKLMIEGPVDVSGSTVKIDAVEELDNLYVLARRAKDTGDTANAALYYGTILRKKPNDWEASFYSKYFDMFDCTYAQIEVKLAGFANSLRAIFALVDGLNEDDYEKTKKYGEIYSGIMSIGRLFQSSVAKKAQIYSDGMKSISANIEGLSSISEVYYKAGELFEKYCVTNSFAKSCYEESIKLGVGYSTLSIENLKRIEPEKAASYERNIEARARIVKRNQRESWIVAIVIILAMFIVVGILAWKQTHH